MVKSGLKLIRGGKFRRYRIGNIHCNLITSHDIPSDLDALVFEEDTHLILTVDGRFAYKETHPVRLMTDLYRAKAHSPGSLIVNGKSWYAVTIDLDADPLCQPEWVQQVYEKIATQLSENDISKLGMFLLGNVHGGLDGAGCVDVFIQAIKALKTSMLQEVWLIVPEKSLKEIRETFENSS